MSRIPRVTDVSTRPPWVLIVEFDDGTVNEVDMAEDLWGETFQPLKDPDYFARAKVNRALGTVEWPNGLDLAPETLYDPSLRGSSTSREEVEG